MMKINQSITKHTSCLRCNRHLTKPESVQRGYGDICYSKLKTIEDRQKSSELLKTWFESSITIKRGKHK